MTNALERTSQEEEETQHGKFLTFYLGREVFGIEIRYVTEIVGIQKISVLPESPDYIKGIINLRGKIIPVIDMRLRFKKDAASYTDRTCIVVINIMDTTVGLIVDQVDEVISISDESIVPPPDFRTGFQNKFLKGIGKISEKICLLLDCEQLFRNDEIDALHHIEA